MYFNHRLLDEASLVCRRVLVALQSKLHRLKLPRDSNFKAHLIKISNLKLGLGTGRFD